MRFRTRTILAGVLSGALLFVPFPTHALNSQKARYDSGTIAQIPKGQTGKLIAGNTNLHFEWKKGDYAIPFTSILDMEYGDTPSVRIGTSIGVALACWSCGKKPKYHFLTLEFAQGATKQVVAFEMGKALPPIMLPTLAMKTGKTIVYQQIRAVTLEDRVANYRTTKARVKPRMGFLRALELTKTVKTEAVLNATYGPPNYIGTFNPSRGDVWFRTEIFIPARLIYALPVGTKMLTNRFDTSFYDGSSGDLTAYIDKEGEILGWSYSFSLSGESGEYHYLADLPPCAEGTKN